MLVMVNNNQTVRLSSKPQQFIALFRPLSSTDVTCTSVV